MCILANCPLVQLDILTDCMTDYCMFCYVEFNYNTSEKFLLLIRLA